MDPAGQPDRRTRHTQVISQISRRVQPYWLHAYLICFTLAGLFADSRVTALWQQDLLGALSFTALFLAALKVPKEQRVQIWICVAIATGYEIFGSLIWGIYHYRMHNLPLYVPAGHGIVYLFGLLAIGTPLIQRHGRRIAYFVLAAAAAWALLGVTALAHVTGRVDVQGALWLPYFAYFMLRSPRWPVFAAIFVIVAELEICGTFFGNWYWMPVAPWTHIPSGNPPSVVAGGYCVIDATVLGALWLARNYRVGWKTIMITITTTTRPRIGPIMRLLLARRWYSSELVSPESAKLI
jgi:hypothetical protein